MKTLNTVQNKMANSISIKVVIIGMLSLLLLIPNGMIQNLIKERQSLRDVVVQEISDKWGKNQELCGPILTIPYTDFIEQDEKIQKITRLIYVLPEELSIKGEIGPEIRYRGIYKVVVYESNLDFKGYFEVPACEKLKIEPENINWENAYISIGIHDMRGIQNDIKIDWDGQDYDVEPGTRNSMISSGISTNVKVNAQKSRYSFNLDLSLNGSQHLYFTPVGKTTNIELSSKWPDPKFTGAYLPDFREVTESGFIAKWQVLHLNRNYPQIMKNTKFSLSPSQFGLDLLLPVDEYQKSYRASKYAFMFIALTFITFLFVEIINKKRIHPIQYLIISAGLLLFYTLLLSVSEQFGFNIAYLVSSVSIIALTTYYSSTVFKSKWITIVSSTIIFALYIFLFTILQIQDYSLLLGSIGLFIVLAAIMYLSRKIDWYQDRSKNVNSIQDPNKLY